MHHPMIVPTLTLAGSLAGYFLARHMAKDSVPFVMIGGFAGLWLGEMISARNRKA